MPDRESAFGDRSGHWIERMRASGFDWKLLYARSATEFASNSDVDVAAAEAVLEKLPKNKSDLRVLAALHLLCDGRLMKFFTEELDKLAKSASRSTATEIEESRGGVRGALRWNTTLLMRRSCRIDTATFMVARRAASWNTPENQVLRLFLTEVSGLLGGVGAESGIRSHFHTMKSCADRVLRQQWLRDVDKIAATSSWHVAACRRAREGRYGDMVLLQLELESVLRLSKWESILRLLSEGWLKPLSEDDCFELYALVLVLSCLKDLCGAPSVVNLIKPGTRELARFETPLGDTVRVYFDQSPASFAGASTEYGEVLKRYSLKGNVRRPDIVLEIEASGFSKRYLFIECKRTSDDGYVRESVYKVLAYLRDFSSLWASCSDVHPKAMILFPNFVSQAKSRRECHDIWLSAADDTDTIRNGLECFLNAHDVGEVRPISSNN